LADANYLNNKVLPPVTSDFEPVVTDKFIDNQMVSEVVTAVTTVTAKKQHKLSAFDTSHAGDACASGEYFRDILPYQDITHEEAGMVQCRYCGHVQLQGKSEPGGHLMGRCRNPDQHGGRWLTLSAGIWRRCGGYQVQKPGYKGAG
jgi:hypothetical protein